MRFDRASDYVGLPWLDRGRDRRGVDCWGLHRLVYAECLGIDLPSYEDGYAGPADRSAIDALIAAGRCDWQPICASRAAPFDLVLIVDRPWHVGTLTGGGRMLHAPEGRDSVIEALTRGRFGRSVEGFYRHAAVAALMGREAS